MNHWSTLLRGVRFGRGLSPRIYIPLVCGLVVLAVMAPSAVKRSAQPTASPPSSAVANAPRPQGLQSFLAEDFVTENARGVIVVDFSKDPAAAERALSRAQEFLDGRHIQVTGIRVLPPSERHAQDAALSRGEKPVAPQLCPSAPTGARSPNGVARAYLGCDVNTGSIDWGSPVAGTPADSLRGALVEVFNQHGLDVSSSMSVTLEGGGAAVSMSPDFISRTSGLQTADGLLLQEALLLTAYQDGAVTSIAFDIGGDCLAYALALGFDTCLSKEFRS